jgi:hypothetical protein
MNDGYIRNFIIDSTRHSNTNTEHLQQLQSSSSLPTRTRHTKHSSGQAEQNPETVVRIIDPKSNVQENQSTMGPTTSGRICGQTQPTTTNILVSELGPGGDSDRCLPTRLENQRSLPLPTMEDDSTSITANQKTTTQENSVSDFTMAKPVLVSNDTANETPATTNHLEAEFKMVLSCMCHVLTCQ